MNSGTLIETPFSSTAGFELAAQVETAFRDFARFTDIRTVAVFGGVGYGAQRSDLKRGVDIIVATPGRLVDYLKTGEISLRDITILILDEVDRMLDLVDLTEHAEKMPAKLSGGQKQRVGIYASALPSVRPMPDVSHAGQIRRFTHTSAVQSMGAG